jgi:hypothetical protein
MGSYINTGNAGFQSARNGEYALDKDYPAKIVQYTDNLLLVGINYNHETKKHECHIEKHKA